MLRKALLTTACLLTVLPPAHAGYFYLGPTIVYQTMSVNNAGYNGIAPRMTLGYEDMLTPVIYTGVEIFSNPTTIKVYNNPSDQGSLRVTYSYGASLLPGINFDNTIVGYGRLGLIRTRFDNLGQVKSGVEYGVGIKWMLNDLWSAKGEYTYTKYNNINPMGHPSSNTYSIGLLRIIA